MRRREGVERWRVGRDTEEGETGDAEQMEARGAGGRGGSRERGEQEGTPVFASAHRRHL